MNIDKNKVLVGDIYIYTDKSRKTELFKEAAILYKLDNGYIDLCDLDKLEKEAKKNIIKQLFINKQLESSDLIIKEKASKSGDLVVSNLCYYYGKNEKGKQKTKTINREFMKMHRF
ncbi:MAG TPA: hypothetical protein PLV83_00945 [Bacilli bacterium]|nr:hypothetical protein [Bacilli bacterium]